MATLSKKRLQSGNYITQLKRESIFLDTANVYARGQSEVVVGKAIKQLKRDQIVLATKVFFPMADGPNDRGLSRKHVFEQCHLSLKRLNVEYIDLYQCHRFDPEVPLFELVRAMDDLTRQGKILYWGVSEWQAEQIEEACAIAESLGAMPPVSNSTALQHVVPQYRRSCDSNFEPARIGAGCVFSACSRCFNRQVQIRRIATCRQSRCRFESQYFYARKSQ